MGMGKTFYRGRRASGGGARAAGARCLMMALMAACEGTMAGWEGLATTPSHHSCAVQALRFLYVYTSGPGEPFRHTKRSI